MGTSNRLLNKTKIVVILALAFGWLLLSMLTIIVANVAFSVNQHDSILLLEDASDRRMLIAEVETQVMNVRRIAASHALHMGDEAHLLSLQREALSTFSVLQRMLDDLIHSFNIDPYMVGDRRDYLIETTFHLSRLIEFYRHNVFMVLHADALAGQETMPIIHEHMLYIEEIYIVLHDLADAIHITHENRTTESFIQANVSTTAGITLGIVSIVIGAIVSILAIILVYEEVKQ
ncbi:MAG: hypothetical protein FWC16_14585 [Defluviitaleaceae bacterium]|nr:hypothetical protein [Defluviitaleaceae bacterium]MCL2276142.1 hypothetical protein [Defluviitaleaceae bacterium]